MTPLLLYVALTLLRPLTGVVLGSKFVVVGVPPACVMTISLVAKTVPKVHVIVSITISRRS